MEEGHSQVADCFERHTNACTNAPFWGLERVRLDLQLFSDH
jgi:hypothetical protein